MNEEFFSSVLEFFPRIKIIDVLNSIKFILHESHTTLDATLHLLNGVKILSFWHWLLEVHEVVTHSIFPIVSGISEIRNESNTGCNLV